MLVKYKKLREDAVDPSRANVGDAGVDLTAVSVKGVYSKDGLNLEYIEYDTGVAFAIPKGHVGLLFSRSSVSKYGLILANCVGVIDSGYRDSVKFRFKVIDDNMPEYQVGDRVGQLVIVPIPSIVYEEVDELDDTERGTGGFGSSGR